MESDRVCPSVPQLDGLQRNLAFRPKVTYVRTRRAGVVPRMGKSRGVYRILMRKPEGKSNLGDPGVDGTII
jgi:hypothetical protein